MPTMRSSLRYRAKHLARRVLLCCLLVALPVYGFSATIVQLLGASHYHRLVAANPDPMAGWQDFRRSGQIASAHVHLHPHSHSVFERHHHAADDDTVVALDGHGRQDSLAGDGPATAGSACQTLATSDHLAPSFVLAVAPVDWLLPPPDAITTRESEPLDRPPKA